LKKRYYQSQNDNQRVTATLSAIAINALSSFGKDKSDSVSPTEFLPFNFKENPYPELTSYTAFLILQLEKENKIPPPIIRALYANPLYQSIKDLG